MLFTGEREVFQRIFYRRGLTCNHFILILGPQEYIDWWEGPWLVFADAIVRLFVLYATIKSMTLRFIGVFCTQKQSGAGAYFQSVESFLTTSLWVVLAVDWNADLDSDVDCSGQRLETNKSFVKPFRHFIDRSNLVDKFRNEYGK